jgi:hypothetical protein
MMRKKILIGLALVIGFSAPVWVYVLATWPRCPESFTFINGCP